MRKASLAALLGFLTLGLIVVPASVAGAATTLVVDDNLACPGATFSTIQAAENVAAPGDTIQVCAGTYAETVLVNVADLMFEGPQAGVDARTRTAVPEAVVGAPGGGFVVSADSVTIDGFTLTGVTNTNPFGGTALLTGPSTSGHDIVNNIVTGNIIGSYINTDGVAPTTVQHNLFDDNNNPGPASGHGIYTDQGLKNVTITENKFTGNDSAGVGISPFGGANADITVSNNEFTGNGNAVYALGASGANLTTNVDILDNTMDSQAASQVGVFGDVSGILIDGNTITNGLARGVRVIGSQDSDVTVSNNSISGNALEGVDNEDTGLVVNAVHNWWGAADGPLGSTPGPPASWGIGSGDAVSAEVDFFPWYTDAAMTTLRTCDLTATAGVWLQVRGTNAGQVVCGSPGADLIRAWRGSDLILGNGGHDHIYGGRGDDALIGGAGNDILAGNHDFDSIQGRGGTDSCKVGMEGGQTSSCQTLQAP
ncbi:MAG TPA: right-handed parallel beta-helix repeat-containing protein [Actinomycetota bacterium]|nr:right-handed parallel beta-helix repeat-containing protein [Actinomycetota bacterium]